MGDTHTLACADGGRAALRRERQMWVWVGGIFGICLAIFLVRSSNPLAEAEESFQRLLPPNRVITTYPLDPDDLPWVPEAQAAFARHGTNAVKVTAQHIETVLSRRAFLTLGLSYKLLPESFHKASHDNWTTSVARCALAIEGMGDENLPLVQMLARMLLLQSGPWTRRVAAAQMLGLAGPEGELVLSRGLTNANSTIREAAVDGLRIWLHRKSTAPARGLPIVVDAATWTAVTAGQGIYKEDNERWAKWGVTSAWMFETNGVWLLSAHFQEMQSPSLARRLTSTEALANMLKTNRTGFASVRSNFVSACLDVLTDPEPSERGRAAAALASAGTSEPRALAALERTLSDPNRMVREDATNALQKLRR